MKCHEEDEVDGMCRNVEPEPSLRPDHNTQIPAGIIVTGTPAHTHTNTHYVCICILQHIFG